MTNIIEREDRQILFCDCCSRKPLKDNEMTDHNKQLSTIFHDLAFMYKYPGSAGMIGDRQFYSNAFTK